MMMNHPAGKQAVFLQTMGAVLLAVVLIMSGCSSQSTTTRDVSGNVTAYGLPLAGVTVTLSGAADRTTTTDANGHYLFSALEEGSYAVTPSLAGYNFSPAIRLLTIRGADGINISFGAISVGMVATSFHTLYLDNSYTLWVWGLNADGQLGDGTIIAKQSPVAISLSGVIAIAAGDAHTVARMSDSTIRAWGSNSRGQLGDGAVANSAIPIAPSNLAGLTITAVAAGDAHTVALLSDGTVRAWGDNIHGQLGDGTSGGFSSTPITAVFPAGLTMTAVSAGYHYSAALCSDGTVWTWGLNAHGQLGNNSTTDASAPVQVIDLTQVGGFLAGVIAISAGHDNTLLGNSHTVALKSDGTVWAWGNNSSGQLGDGSVLDRLTPVQATGLTAMTLIAAGFDHTVALKNDGTVWVWGNNGKGQLGDGTLVSKSVPVQVPGLTDIMHVAAGFENTIVRKKDGTVWAWGNNSNGQLGDGSTTDRSVPTKIK